jgi:RNA polymerase subunit RPABC4/transcription elongation factor Spt4
MTQVYSICTVVTFILIFLFVILPIYLISQGRESSKRVINYSMTQGRYCPNCKRSIPIDANICPYCAKKLIQPTQNLNFIYCPNCGTQLLFNSQFCYKCGYKF